MTHDLYWFVAGPESGISRIAQINWHDLQLNVSEVVIVWLKNKKGGTMPP